jgi:hypothetical protein
VDESAKAAAPAKKQEAPAECAHTFAHGLGRSSRATASESPTRRSPSLRHAASYGPARAAAPELACQRSGWLSWPDSDSEPDSRKFELEPTVAAAWLRWQPGCAGSVANGPKSRLELEGWRSSTARGTSVPIEESKNLEGGTAAGSLSLKCPPGRPGCTDSPECGRPGGGLRRSPSPSPARTAAARASACKGADRTRRAAMPVGAAAWHVDWQGQ